MGQNDEIKFLGNADQLLKEYEKLEAKDKKREETLKKGAKAAKESAREQAALERQAAKIREKNLTDLQRHEKALKQLDTLKKRQILTEKEYLAAVAKEKDEYRKNSAEFKEAQQVKQKLKQKEIDLTKKAATEQAALEQEAAKIREKSLTDMQRHEKALKQLDNLKNRQILTEKEYLAAVAKEKDEYRKNSAEFKESQQVKQKLKQKEIDLNKKAATEQKKFSEEGKRLSEAARTPLQKYNAEMGKLNQQLKAGNISMAEHARLSAKARSEYRGATQSGGRWGKAIAGMATSLAGYATGLVSVTALLRLFISELEKAEALRNKARDATLTEEEGLQRARANFVADKTVSKKDLDNELRKAAEESGVSTAEFATAAADTFSARGDRSNRFAIDATKAAFAASPNKEVESARELAQSAGDFAKLGGSQSAEAIVGFLTQGQQSARITDVSKLGKAAFPATASALQAGASIEQGMEQFIALNNLIGDSEGRISSTASISLTEQLQKFEGTQGIAGGPSAQIQALQDNPELAKTFMDQASFEKKSLAGVRSLVMGDERGLAALKDAQVKIGSLDAQDDQKNIKAFKDFSSFVQGKETLAGELKLVGDKITQNIERAGAGNTDRAIIAETNKLLKETFENVNLPGFDATQQFAINRQTQAIKTPEKAIEFAKLRLTLLLDVNDPLNAETLKESGPVGILNRRADPFKGTIKDPEDAKLIREQLKVLQDIEQILQRSQKDQNKNAGKQERAANNQGKQPPQLGNDRRMRGQ